MGWDRRAATAAPVVERVVCLSFEVSVCLFSLIGDAGGWIGADRGGVCTVVNLPCPLS